MLNSCDHAPKWKLFSAVPRAASYHGVCDHMCVYVRKERGEGKWGRERGETMKEKFQTLLTLTFFFLFFFT